MPLLTENSLVMYILRRRYWAFVISLTCAIWVLLAFLMYPLKNSDGTYTSYPLGLTTEWENRALDLLFQLRDARHPGLRARGQSEPISIIEIDEASIKVSRVRMQKWPRNWYARLVDRASEGGATVIGLDLFLSEEGGTSNEDIEADRQLVESIERAGNVVLATKTGSGGFDELKPLPAFADAAYATGFADFPLDGDGFVRSSQLFLARKEGALDFSFATRLAEGHLLAQKYAQKFSELRQRGLDEQAATEEAGAYAQQSSMLKTGSADGEVLLNDRILPLRTDLNLQLDFRGRAPAFRRISARDVLFEKNAQIPDDFFRDRVVLIGATNLDAPDQFPTPLYEPSLLARMLDRSLRGVPPARTPGIELHATSVATLLFGHAPIRPRYGLQVASLILPLALAALSIFLLRVFRGLLAVALIAVASLVVASWAFNAHGLILPLASVWLGLGLLTPAGLGLRYARERVLRAETEEERAQVMDIFSRFVSREVAQEMWEQRGQLSLSGERRVVTVIFTDIRNFTSLSEHAPSGEVVEWLNDYFGRMQEVITSFGGHINKFIGDGMMIVFGAPVDRGASVEAQAAVDCALKMLESASRINEEWKAKGRPEFKIGVGINSGEATCGVVGARQRLEYTIIGDAVNLASRLESMTKDIGVSIIISESTARLLDDAYEVEALGSVKVKGKSANTSIHTVKSKKTKDQKSSPTIDNH
jgi:adenylate cyclase